MADVLNRATKEYRTSVNTPDYNNSQWIINPDVSQVQDIPSKFWRIPNQGKTITYNEQSYLENVKYQRTRLVNEFRELVLYEGFIYEDGNVFDTDNASLRNLMGLSQKAITSGLTTETVQYMTSENILLTISYNEIVQVTLSLSNYVSECYEASWYHKDQINALSTISEVNNYDYTVGAWPVVQSYYLNPSKSGI